MVRDDSPAASFINSDLFNLLEQDVFKYGQLGSIYIAGDWNCRVGNKADFIKCDKSISDIDSDDYYPDEPPCRTSSDLMREVIIG